MMRRFYCGVAAVLLSLHLTLGHAIAGDVATANDMARFLAGMSPSTDSPLQRLTKQASWQDHARRFDASWANLERRQLSKIRLWTKSAVVKRQPIVFYMFSGPDFLYANALLPDASTYVLSGLEPVGSIPTVEGLQNVSLSRALRGLESSLNSIFSYSFFITSEMKYKLRSHHLEGTLPILLAFLARSDKIVHEIALVGLHNDGTLEPENELTASKSGRGVKIIFSSADSAEKRILYYFSTNLDDGGVKGSGFLAFCNSLGTGDSLVKSASYLLHQSNFSEVRDFLLTHTATLIQDDSGIPLQNFDPTQWNLQAYGTYNGPIAIFRNRYQGKLHRLFAKTHPALDFGIGYRWHARESNLLVATRLVNEADDAPRTSQQPASGAKLP
jgi:hypothetical protein